MLTEIYIDGFRTFNNFRITFNNLTTLICGLNGAGKSSLIDIVYRIKNFICNGIRVDKLCSIEDIPVWENRSHGRFTTKFELKIINNGLEYTYAIDILHNLRDKISRVEHERLIVGEKIIFESNSGKVTTFSNISSPFPISWDISGLNLLNTPDNLGEPFITFLQEKLFCLQLNPFIMEAFSRGKDKDLLINGENFSAWYSWVKSNYLKGAVLAMEDISAFFPNFNQFDFIEHGTSQELVGLISAGSNNNYTLSFNQFSLGQKVLVVLYMVIRTCKENSTVILDEMENFISYVELQPIYDLANQVTEDKNVQFIFISHNTKTLNWYESESIILKQINEFPPRIIVEDALKEDITLEDELWLERGSNNEI